MSQNSISSVPKIDCDCIFALKSPKVSQLGKTLKRNTICGKDICKVGHL